MILGANDKFNNSSRFVTSLLNKKYRFQGPDERPIAGPLFEVYPDAGPVE